MALSIALINPPQYTRYPQPPMGLAQIAAVLERDSYRVSLIDANALKLNPGEVASQVTDADIVGLTAMTPTINAAINIARVIKQVKPELPVVLGGPHATLLPEETLNTAPEIDIIVRGEGEEVFIDLLKNMDHHKTLSNVPGINYRKDGHIINNLSPTTNVDLDSLPFLAYHRLPRDKYRPHPPHGRDLPFAAIITSRGCPYKCSYCSKPIGGAKFRGQSPERVIAEIVYYMTKFGVREIAFYDDVFTLNQKRACAIAEGMLNRKLKIHWTCETRVNLVDKELLQLLRRAGCYAIAYGIESASPQILATINKGITLEQIEEAVAITREAGLQTIGYFMVGSPGETPQSITETINFAKRLKLDFAQFSIPTPFPGTELYDLYLKDKSNRPVDWENFTYASLGKKTVPLFESEELKQADLQSWVRRAYREFYLRPSYLWQRLRQIRSVGDLRVDFRGFFMLVQNIKP